MRESPGVNSPGSGSSSGSRLSHPGDACGFPHTERGGGAGGGGGGGGGTGGAGLHLYHRTSSSPHNSSEGMGRDISRDIPRDISRDIPRDIPRSRTASPHHKPGLKDLQRSLQASLPSVSVNLVNINSPAKDLDNTNPSHLTQSPAKRKKDRDHRDSTREHPVKGMNFSGTISCNNSGSAEGRDDDDDTAPGTKDLGDCAIVRSERSTPIGRGRGPRGRGGGRGGQENAEEVTQHLDEESGLTYFKGGKYLACYQLLGHVSRN